MMLLVAMQSPASAGRIELVLQPPGVDHARNSTRLHLVFGDSHSVVLGSGVGGGEWEVAGSELVITLPESPSTSDELQRVIGQTGDHRGQGALLGAGVSFFSALLVAGLVIDDGSGLGVVLPVVLAAPVVGAIVGSRIGKGIPRNVTLYERQHLE